MAKIPRSEASVDFRPTPQPFSTGDGYEAPGRGLQKIGQGIQAGGEALMKWAAVQDEEDVYKTKLALLKMANEQDSEDIERQRSFNIDRDDPELYPTERITSFQGRAESVLSGARSQRARRLAELQIERLRGSVGERAQRFAGAQRQQQLYYGAERAITGEFDRLSEPIPSSMPVTPPAAPESPAGGAAAAAGREVDAAPVDGRALAAERFERAVRAAEAIIADNPGDASVKERLAKHVEGLARAYFGKRGESWPEAESWLRRQQQNPPATPDGVGSVRTGAWKIYDRDTPTAAERRAIAQAGGVVVNLDTNWAKGDRPTTPLVVIPDNATPQQRAAAEAYAAGVAQIYKQQFGLDMKPRVLTRSQNGRGRNDTIHTEPYSVNHSQAVDYFNSPEGRKAHAELLRSTFGKVAGVAFSLPHDPTRRGDNGAVGPKGSEVDFARGLLAELRGGGAVPEGVAAGAPRGIKARLTAYAPQAGGDRMQGGYAAARPGPDGKAEVRTLDDVASGRSKYVTVAGNPSLNGRQYTIPRIEFIDKSGKKHVLENVQAVVHDSGRAFRDAPEGRFDVPVARDADEKLRNANHALWEKAGVEFIPAAAEQTGAKAEQPVRVAQAGTDVRSDATPAGRIPAVAGDVSRSVTSSPVRSAITEMLIKAGPEMQRRYLQGIASQIERAERASTEGYDLPDAEWEQLGKTVQESGSEELVQRFDMVTRRAQAARTVRQMSPDQMRAAAQQMRATFSERGATPEEIDSVKKIEAMAEAADRAIEKDPYAHAVTTGVLPAPPPPIDLRAGAQPFAQALAARAEINAVLSHRWARNGVPRELPFFTPEEKNGLLDLFDGAMRNAGSQGGPEAVRTMIVGTLGLIHETLGPATPRAMAEISKEAPALASVGWLVSRNANPQTIKDAIAGMVIRQTPGYKSAAGQDADRRRVTRTVTGIGDDYAFRGNPQAPLLAGQVADLIYEARMATKGGKPDVFDEKAYAAALQEAMGQNQGPDGKTTYGGMTSVSTGWLSSYRTFVPPNIRTDGGLAEIQSKLRITDLMQPIAGRSGGPDGDVYEVPGRADGVPLTTAELRSAELEWRTGSKYALRIREADGVVRYAKLVGGTGNEDYLLDIEALRPVIENRVDRGVFRPDGRSPQPVLDPLAGFRSRKRGTIGDKQSRAERDADRSAP